MSISAVPFGSNVVRLPSRSRRDLVSSLYAENGMKYDLEARLATNEAARVLSVSTSFLNKSRLFGNGPEFEKRGRLVRYRYGTLLDYMTGQTRRSTSDNGKAA
jgi:hypothetical protein